MGSVSGSNCVDRSVTGTCLVLLDSISLVTGNIRRRCDLLVWLGRGTVGRASGHFGSGGSTLALSVDWRSSEQFVGLLLGNGISSLGCILRVAMALFTGGILSSMLALDIG